MKQLTWVTGVMLVLAAVGAEAHARLKSSNPTEGATVTEMMTSISLTFSESARITAVALQKDSDPKQKLPAPTSTGETIAVTIPMLSAGAYTLTWRVASTDDNHIMSGELHFKIAPIKMDMPMKN